MNLHLSEFPIAMALEALWTEFGCNSTPHAAMGQLGTRHL